MAAPRACNAQVIAGGPGVIFASQLFGQWVLIHEQVDDFAESAAVMLAPSTYADIGAAVHPLIINEGTALRLCCRYDGDTFGPVTSPTFRVWGCDQVPNSAGRYPSGSIFWRIDNSGFTSAGSTFTFAFPNDQSDSGANKLTSQIFSPAGMNLRGARSVLFLHEVNGSAAGSIMQVFAQVIN